MPSRSALCGIADAPTAQVGTTFVWHTTGRVVSQPLHIELDETTARAVLDHVSV